MKRELACILFGCAAAAVLLFGPDRASAHGFVGDRFFPPTITTDDPFAVDEFAFPTVSIFKNPAGDGPSNVETDAGFEFDKEIFSYFALGIHDTYISQKPHHGPGSYGWDNIAVTAKFELYHDAAHEFILSVGTEADLGGTGSKSIADNFSTIEPYLYMGKGFGDLPDSLGALRPFAVTSQFGQSFPTSAAAANTFDWGFAVEYSLPYLQAQVQDVGLPHPFRDMIPLVEFSMSTPENRGGGPTTGVIAPGILYENPYFQLGAEAQIPLNSASGKSVGAVVQVWIYIDDIWPNTFGHPLFGGERAPD